MKTFPKLSFNNHKNIFSKQSLEFRLPYKMNFLGTHIIIFVSSVVLSVSFAQSSLEILHSNQHEIISIEGEASYRRPDWTHFSPMSTGTLLRGDEFIALSTALIKLTVVCHGQTKPLQLQITADTTAYRLCNVLALHGSTPAQPLFMAQSFGDTPELLEPLATTLKEPHIHAHWESVPNTQYYTFILRDEVGNLVEEVRSFNNSLTLPNTLEYQANQRNNYTIEVKAHLFSDLQILSKKVSIALLSQQELAQLQNAELQLRQLSLSESAERYALASLYSRYQLYLDATQILNIETSPAAILLLAELKLVTQQPEQAYDLYKSVLQDDKSNVLIRVRSAQRLAELSIGPDSINYENQAERFLNTLK